MPATTLVLRPPFCPPAVASAAAIGEVAADLTPLHRSLVALRLGATTRAGAFAVVGALARGFDEAFAGLAVTGRARVTGAAAAGAVTLGGTGATRGAGAVVRFGELGRVGVVRELDGELFTAPLVVAEAVAPDFDGAVLADGALTGAVAGAPDGAVVAPTGAGAVTGGVAVEAGGLAGLAGVPNPDGVHAQARPAPTTATPSKDRTARLNIRARCTGTSLR